MKGDFTRFTHSPRKHYTGVLKQQGRVDLDADWNEQVAIQEHLDRVTNLDVIGRCGVPLHGGGFTIDLVDGGQDLSISTGRIYVDGILCELEPDPQGITTFHHQPDYSPAASEWPDDTANAHRDLVYLDVWQRHITALEDPEIREIALGGPDTTTRLKTVWQVKVRHNVGEVDCDTPVGDWAPAPSTGQLSVHVATTPPETNPCIPAPGGGYQGLENRLYRVEIHDGGALTGDGEHAQATFKWSRDNGSVVFAIDEVISPTSIRVKSLGKDQVLALHGGDWVEIIDEETELRGERGALLRIQPDGVNEAERTITLEGNLTDVATRSCPKVRRWDMPSEAIPTTATPYPLEDGIEVTFSGDTFNTGDYWVFAARAATGEVEPLVNAPPRGIEHHYCALAFVTWSPTGDGGALVPSIDNCEHLFPPLTELPEGGGGCESVICVAPGNEDGDSAAIQSAIDAVIAKGGGEVCLEKGNYVLAAPLRIPGAHSLRLRGQGPATRLVYSESDGSSALNVGEFSRDVVMEGFYVAALHVQEPRGSCLSLRDCQAVTIRHCRLESFDPDAKRFRGRAIRLGGSVRDIVIQSNELRAGTGIWAIDDVSSPANVLDRVRIEDNFLGCDSWGICLQQTHEKGPGDSIVHLSACRIAGNVIESPTRLGIVAYGEPRGEPGDGPCLDIVGNLIRVASTQDGVADAVVVGTSDVRIEGNHIAPTEFGSGGDGIVLDTGSNGISPARCQVLGNRVVGMGGHGIAIAGPITSAIVKQNCVERVGGSGIIVLSSGRADYLSVENNEVRDVALIPPLAQGGWTPESQPSGICLFNVDRAEVAGNLVDGAGQVDSGDQYCYDCVGIQLAAVDSARVLSNEVAAIGPESPRGAIVGIDIMHDPAQSYFVELGGNIVGRGQAAEPGGPEMGQFALRVHPRDQTFATRLYDSLLGIRARRAAFPAMSARAGGASAGALTADFTAEPREGAPPLSVKFTDQSAPGSNAIATWLWDFDDGGTSNEQNPTHVYTQAAPRSYRVTLNVRDTGGIRARVSKPDYIKLTVPGPATATLSATPMFGTAPLQVSFSGEASAEVSAWLWDFSDGNTSSEQSPSHVFSDPGTYTVTLTASGADWQAVATGTIQVLSKPTGEPQHAVTVRGNLLESPGGIYEGVAARILADRCVFSDNHCIIPPDGWQVVVSISRPTRVGQLDPDCKAIVLGNIAVGVIKVNGAEHTLPWEHNVPG